MRQREAAGLADENEHGKFARRVKTALDATKAKAKKFSDEVGWVFGMLCQLKTLGERSYSSRSISQEKLCAFNRSLPDHSPRATSGSGMPSPDGSAPLLGGDAPAENAQRSDQTVPGSAVLAPAT